MVEFTGSGGSIAVKSGYKPETLRGATLDFVVLDEAAYLGDDVWEETIRPMLMTTGGRALMLSTPLGLNWFHDVYLRGLDGNAPDYAAFHYTAFDNPLIPPGELDGMKAEMTTRAWQQEIMAEFLADGGAVFRGVRDAIRTPPSAPEAGRIYYMGIDWGKHNDFTVLVIIDDLGQVCALDRFNQIDYTVQRQRVKLLADRWRVRRITAETNSIGEPNIEELRRDGLPVSGFTTTARSKNTAIEALQLGIEQQTIGLLNDPALIGELLAFGLERLPSGLYRYSAPSGKHDDCVMALAMAYQGIGTAWKQEEMIWF
jgi:hypothetical protein